MQVAIVVQAQRRPMPGPLSVAVAVLRVGLVGCRSHGCHWAAGDGGRCWGRSRVEGIVAREPQLLLPGEHTRSEMDVRPQDAWRLECHSIGMGWEMVA